VAEKRRRHEAVGEIGRAIGELAVIRCPDADSLDGRKTVDAEVDVEPHTWEAFRLTAIDGLSGAEVAARLGMQVGTLFKAKSKVQKMLRDEVDRLNAVIEARP
jgi:DNA-directed RNA polymerase specialized sigma24 family protein